MKKLFYLSFIIYLVHSAVYSEDNNLSDTYIKYFQKGELETKIEIIKKAVNIKDTNMGPLFHEALGFITLNASRLKMLKTSPAVGEMVILSIQKIGEIPYKEARYTLWKLYQEDDTTIIRINILDTLSNVAKGDKNIINGLNQWLYKQNNSFLTQYRPDFQVVDACIRTLGALKDSSSFPYIFKAMNLQYSVLISETALKSLYLIEGNLKNHLISIIENNPVQDKYDALAFCLETDKLFEEEQKDIITYALDKAISTDTAVKEDLNIFKEIRYLSIRSATIFKIEKVSANAVKHFDLVSREYREGRAAKTHLIEAIDCLGVIKTKDAAKKLSEHLEYVNSYTEQTRVYDEQVVLTVINNIVKANDPIGFEPIQYAVFLGYSDRIKNVAREAALKLMK